MRMANGCERCAKPVKVGLELTLDSETADLRVIDGGSGLTRKQQKNIFSPFYTTKKTGSGLGLYLSREIVTQMGGQMGLDSTPKIGTTVIIKLPVRPRRPKE